MSMFMSSLQQHIPMEDHTREDLPLEPKEVLDLLFKLRLTFTEMHREDLMSMFMSSLQQLILMEDPTPEGLHLVLREQHSLLLHLILHHLLH
jgi:hypothetical protein